MNGLAARGACVCALAATLCAAGCLHHAGWLLQHTNSLYWRIYLFAPAADLCYTLRTLIYCKLNNFVFGSALAAQLPQLSLTLFLVILHVLFRRVCVCAAPSSWMQQRSVFASTALINQALVKRAEASFVSAFCYLY
jgi:hypothetical protein